LCGSCKKPEERETKKRGSVSLNEVIARQGSAGSKELKKLFEVKDEGDERTI
jgi:hypothetical protein